MSITIIVRNFYCPIIKMTLNQGKWLEIYFLLTIPLCSSIFMIFTFHYISRKYFLHRTKYNKAYYSSLECHSCCNSSGSRYSQSQWVLDILRRHYIWLAWYWSPHSLSLSLSLSQPCMVAAAAVATSSLKNAT